MHNLGRGRREGREGGGGGEGGGVEREEGGEGGEGGERRREEREKRKEEGERKREKRRKSGHGVSKLAKDEVCYHFLACFSRGGGFLGMRNRALIGCMLQRAAWREGRGWGEGV